MSRSLRGRLVRRTFFLTVGGAPTEPSGAILARLRVPQPANMAPKTANLAPKTADLAAKMRSDGVPSATPSLQNRSRTLPDAPGPIFSRFSLDFGRFFLDVSSFLARVSLTAIDRQGEIKKNLQVSQPSCVWPLELARMTSAIHPTTGEPRLDPFDQAITT